MSHDIEAAWAGAELAALISGNPTSCFAVPPAPADVSTYAGREGKTIWPHADGVVEVADASAGETYSVAIEYKRPNEGLHGILTALGQSHAYLRKGYAGSIMVLPRQYPGLADTGVYVSDVLNNTSRADSIGVCVYDTPDRSKVSPFSGKINFARALSLDRGATAAGVGGGARTETQWVHVREGSSEPDAYFRYLQAVKLVSGDDFVSPPFNPSRHLINAVNRLRPGADPALYLSNAPGNNMHDRAWRYFWFKNILTDQMMVGWNVDATGTYVVNHVVSNISKANGHGKKQFFSGKTNSKKNSLVERLNLGTLTEPDAWEQLAQNIHDRAHSYREDIDSGLEGVGFIDQHGRMTESGYRFLDSCEKASDPNSGLPRTLFSKALLDEGGLATFLHYVHKLSDQAFSTNPLRFSANDPVTGILKFSQDDYLSWIEDKMENDLHVLRKVAARGGQARKPFQGELAILRGNGIILKGFRVGVGIPINWPEVQKILEI